MLWPVSPMAVRIECSRVVKRFGAVTVLDHLDWTVEAGAVIGLLGGSGAGKTTLLRVVAGLERCTSGRVELRSSEGDRRKSGTAVGMLDGNAVIVLIATVCFLPLPVSLTVGLHHPDARLSVGAVGR